MSTDILSTVLHNMPFTLKSASMSTKKHAQYESCEITFTWHKMRTVAWEIALQIALKNCSKEVVWEGQYIILVNGEFSAIKHLFSKGFLLVKRS